MLIKYSMCLMCIKINFAKTFFMYYLIKKSWSSWFKTYTLLTGVDCLAPLTDSQCVSTLRQGDKVNYERFRNWLLQNKEAFTLSRWLLSGGVCVTLTDDSDTPTFYQTLAGVTHCEFQKNVFVLYVHSAYLFTCWCLHPVLFITYSDILVGAIS